MRPYGKVRKDNKKLVRNEYEAKDRSVVLGVHAACIVWETGRTIAAVAVRGVAEQRGIYEHRA